jgi:hypothetical protein
MTAGLRISAAMGIILQAYDNGNSTTDAVGSCARV